MPKRSVTEIGESPSTSKKRPQCFRTEYSEEFPFIKKGKVWKGKDLFSLKKLFSPKINAKQMYQPSLKMLGEWLLRVQDPKTNIKYQIRVVLGNVPNIMEDLFSYFFDRHFHDLHQQVNKKGDQVMALIKSTALIEKSKK